MTELAFNNKSRQPLQENRQRDAQDNVDVPTYASPRMDNTKVQIIKDSSFVEAEESPAPLLSVKQRMKSAENINQVTFFVMSAVVLVCINVFFGLLALLFSIRAHHKWKGAQDDNARKQAKRLGYIAFVLNALGIITSMTAIIAAFSTNWINEKYGLNMDSRASVS